MESLVSDFATLFKTSSGSDMTLVCSDGGEVRVHSLIMTARSPVFSGMLGSGMIEPRSGRVEVKDFASSVVEAFVQYIYTAHIIGEEFEDIVELMKIGHKYMVKALVDDCGKKLTQMISKSNVLSLGAVAEKLSCEELLQSCAQLVARNVEAKVLVRGLENELKGTSIFLEKVINSMKSLRAREATVTRFQTLAVGRWNCSRRNCSRSGYGYKLDAITVTLDKKATLTSIGLYGTETVGEISVEIEILDEYDENIYTKDTVFKSTGSADPIQIPVDVQMRARKKYSVCAFIKSDNEGTYYGQYGGQSSEYRVKVDDDSLVVMIDDSSRSSNKTSSSKGQIPTLGFVIG